MLSSPHPPMGATHVNYAGEPFAVVIAESIHAARQGAESVIADFEELNGVIDPATAAQSETIYRGH